MANLDEEKDFQNTVSNGNGSEKKDNNNIIICILLLIIGILLGCLIGYGIQNNEEVSNKNTDDVVEESNTDSNESSSTTRELSETEKANLIDQIKVYNRAIPELYGNGNLKLSNQELLEFGSGIIKFEGFTDASLVEERIKKHFYTNDEIKHADVRCGFDGEVLYVYDESTGKYSYNTNHPGHGVSIGISGSYVHYLEGKVENEKTIIVKAKILYGNYCGDICSAISRYYGSYDEVSGETPLLSSGNDEISLNITDELYQSVADKLKVTVFTFEKDSAGNYGLKSVIFE